jgi:hypothetical protein
MKDWKSVKDKREPSKQIAGVTMMMITQNNGRVLHLKLDKGRLDFKIVCTNAWLEMKILLYYFIALGATPPLAISTGTSDLTRYNLLLGHPQLLIVRFKCGNIRRKLWLL